MITFRNSKSYKEIDGISFLVVIFFLLTFALKVFTDGPYLRGEIPSSIAYLKYGTAFFACFFGFCLALKNGGRVFKQEFCNLLTILVIFLLVSSIQQALSQIVSAMVFVELIKLAMPIALSYCVLNSLDEKTLYKCLEIVLVLSFIAYIVDLSHEGVSIFSIVNSDFSKSESPTEHAGLSDIALVLSFYFLFFNQNKWPTVLSVVLCLLTFKRLAMATVLIAAIIAFVFPQIKFKKISNKILLLSKIVTLISVAWWFWMLLPPQERMFIDIFKETPFNFTSGRSGIMRWLLNSNFISFGFGSANAVVKPLFGAPFEMDFIKIAIELTPIALICFIWFFWNITRNNFWSFLIVAFYVANMITSDCLNSNFAFTLAYIVIGTVNYCLANCVNKLNYVIGINEGPQHG